VSIGSVLGIDPGMMGGFVLLAGNAEILEKHVAPRRDEGGLDLDGLALLFSRLSDRASVAYIERPNGTAMSHGHGRGQSISAMFNFGKNCGVLTGMLAAFRIPFHEVHPRTWTSVLHRGIDPSIAPKSKDKSFLVATQRWPRENFLATVRSVKPHDGLVDAALIGLYGLQAEGAPV
jgi:hypothetical protein